MEVTRELATTLDTHRLLPRMVHLFCEMLQTESATIFLFNEDTQELVSGTDEGHSQIGDLFLPYIRVPVSEGLAGKVFRTGTSLISENPYQDEDFYRQIDAENNFKTRNILCVPLQDGDEKSIGVIEVINKKDGKFSNADKHLLEALAHQVCAVFINAKLHETIVRARAEEAQLLELTTAMSQELKLLPLLHTIMTTVTNILGADRSTLFLYDENLVIFVPRRPRSWGKNKDSCRQRHCRVRVFERRDSSHCRPLQR